MNNKVTVSEINKSDENKFLKIFENIVEYYPNISKYLYGKKPYQNITDFLAHTMVYMDNLTITEKEHILKLHPDLGGKLAQEGKLTEESKNEQKSAGLDFLTLEEKEPLTRLNKQYREKFDFPFVICARENNYASIKTKLEERLQNSKETEIQIGFEEVKKITKLRLKDLITE